MDNEIGGRGFTNEIYRVKYGHKARDEGGDIVQIFICTNLFNVNKRYL